MEITLMNYNGEKVRADVGEDIESIFISIISGDEVAFVVYKDHSCKIFDSAEMITNGYRIFDFSDGGYMLFDEKTNLVNDQKWLLRGTSYHGLDLARGEE